MSWVWRWLLLVVALTATTALPVPDETDTSTKVLGSSVVTSVSVVMGHEDGAPEKSDTRKAAEDLPPSTVDMMKPDGFQFYTVDEKGQLITRKMTDSEIQSIIAAGGGPFPMETQDPQKTGDNMSGEMKVADVVQNVKKVLKDEMNKPVMAMGTVPTIPGHANDEWSSILPSILGGESESAPVTIPEADTEPIKEMIEQNMSAAEIPAAAAETSPAKLPVPETPETKPQETKSPVTENDKPTEEKTQDDEMVKIDQKKQPESSGEPAETVQQPPAKETQETPERPMIQVPVITADSVQSTSKDPFMEVEKPVYQILNTISAEEVKDKDAQKPVEEKPAATEPEKVQTIAIPEKESPDSSSAISPAAEKPVSEVKQPEVAEEVPMTAAPATVETIVEMEVSSSFVPSVQGETDKPEVASPALDQTDDVKPAEPAQKPQPPSIILEAPLAEEKPVVPVTKTEEKETPVVPEVKPTSTDQEDQTAKIPAVVQESPSTPTSQTETTSPATTLEEEVSNIANLIPESISSIVDELISESTSVLPVDQVKSEAPGASDNDLKKPEASATEDATKIQDSNNKTDDNGSESSSDKVTPVVPASEAQIPEKDNEPVFEMLPEIIPDSTITKISAETPAPTEIVENKPEATEAVTEGTKIVAEDAVSGDKIEQQSVTSAQSESPENMIPTVEVAASVTDENDDSKTETTAEKKPETLMTELADSVSSMISQVSEVMPAMVPIPQKTETNEPPVKRVEDGVKNEAASTMSSEALKPMVTAAASEEAAKPLVSDVELPVKEETAKPEKIEPEVVMVEVKTPEPTTVSPIIDAPETTKISESVSTDPIPETSNTMKDKIESTESETPVESSSDVKKPEAHEEEKTTEQVEVTTAESVATKISAPVSEQEPMKSEDASKPENLKPEKTENVAKDETKAEAVVSEGEAPMKSEEVAKPEDSKPEETGDVAKDETKLEAADSDGEAPIVRIDITEVKPTDSNVKNDESTESSVVRIQLTNTVATINQMIDSASEAVPAVEVEDISLPEKTVLEASAPQNIGSSLIAGDQASDVAEIETPENSPQLETAASASNEIVENPTPTEAANIESDTKTELKPDVESPSADKPQLEIEKAKIPEAGATQATVEAQPQANNEENNESPTTATEVMKTTEATNESKLEKPTEPDMSKDTSSASAEKEVFPVEPMVKIDPPVPAAEEIKPPMKSEVEEKPEQIPEKIAEPTKVVSEEEIEKPNASEPTKIVKEPTEVPAVPETPTVVPPEVLVSTTVEIEPTKESPVAIKDDIVEPVDSEVKPETTNTKIAPESIAVLDNSEEKKPEADSTATKINEAPMESNDNMVPVKLATPTAARPEVQSSDHVPEVPTPVPASGDKKTEETEVQKEKEVPTTAQSDSESTEKKPELHDLKTEIPAQVEEIKDSAAKPEVVEVEDSKSPSSEDEPENKVPVVMTPAPTEVKESSVPEKDQTSVPLVRIDVTPEKSQTEIETTKKTEKISAGGSVGDDQTAEKPATPTLPEISSAAADESLKKTNKPQDVSSVETSSTQSAELETISSSSESPSKAPVEVVVEETKLEMPTVKEPEVVLKPTEESIKETVNVMDSKLPEVAATVEMTSAASPIATKIENEETAKPVIRIDTTSQNAPNNGPANTQEVRIQVNDTAVLVTKQKIPQKTDSEEKKVLPTDIPDSTINRVEVSSQPPKKIEAMSQEPEKIEVPSKQTEEISVPSEQPEKIEVQNQEPEKIEVPSEQPEKIEVQNQEPEKIQVPSKQPVKIAVLSQPMTVPNVQPDKVHVLSQPTKIQSVDKPTPVMNADKTPSKQDGDKVKTESTSEQKKPLVDPYVKLGENKQGEKPAAESNASKVPVSGNKKPSNTNSADKWTLIPQSEPYPVMKQQVKPSTDKPSSTTKNEDVSVPLEAHKSAVSLDESTRDQDEDISSFSKLCNELAFSFWVAANKGLSTARSLALSPFGMTSMLAMVFLGARGPTSGQMNDILKLDDVVTFNPHLVFQNISDSVNLARGQGIANAAFVRELFADRIKAGRILPFYKERAQQFYDGHVEEVNFATISDLVRRRTNLLIRRQTGGRIRDFVKGNVMPLRSPLAALTANVFQTDCTGASSEGRDGEMYFAVLPSVRQRKLVPVPATVWRSGVLAGYEPGLDATVISLGGVGNLVSTIFVLPGQQGLAAPGDSLDHLEKRLLDGAFTNGVWDRLIRVLIPRMGLEVQVPKFSHRSVVNATAALKRMGLDELFSRHADLKGINGVGNDLHLADMLQINLFSTCGDEVITGGRHHVEIYPATPLRGARRGEKQTMDDAKLEETEEAEVYGDVEKKITRRGLDVGEYIQRSRRSTSLGADKQLLEEDIKVKEEEEDEEERSQRSSSNPKELLQLSKGKQNERPLLKLDRPFLYFVRHNPTGMILHMGRFNPRLMP